MSKLYLIAGHGDGDCGAVGNGYQEAERVRALVAKIKELGGDKVEVLDTNVNWYRHGFTFDAPKGSYLLECHMDSSDNTSAKGGHVIILKGLSADKYDNALAKLMQDILPGRSSLIVGRDDLANPKRACQKGINYRLCEFGFITNAEDVQVFNSRITEIAQRVLDVFELGTVVTPQPAATQPTTQVNANSNIDDLARRTLNGEFGDGEERKRLLGNLYSAVQARVNELCGAAPQPTTPAKKSNEQIAKEVINGDWGNGSGRKNRLEAAGYNYREIQRIVNKMLQ